MPKTIIEGVQEFFKSCPLLKSGKLNVDYLPEDSKKNGVEYSIDPLPSQTFIKKYMDGGGVCQFQFAVSSVNPWREEDLINLENSGFFEELSEWLRTQTRNNTLPELPEGKKARSVESLDENGYLLSTSPGYGKYQMTCRLIYERKGEI